MPRLLNSVPKLRRHATGQGVVTLNGSDYYCGLHGTAKSRERYRRLIQEWLSSGSHHTPKGLHNHTSAW